MNRLNYQTISIFLTGVWLQLLNILFIIEGGLSPYNLQLLVLSSTIILFSLVKIDNKHILNNIAFLFLFLFSVLILLGVYKNSSYSIVIRLLNLIYLFIFSIMFINKINNGFEKLMKVYSVIGILVLLILFKYSLTIENRADFIVHPNFAGMVILGIVFSSMYLKSYFLLAIIYILSSTVLLSLSSRAAILGVLLILFFELSFFRKILLFNIKNKFLKLLIILLVLFLVFYFYLDYLLEIFHFNDSYRGINSGFSSREDTWAKAIKVWSQNFIIGSGYGESPKVLGASVDNAYFNILVELGTLGFILYISFLLFHIIKFIFNKNYRLLIFIFIYILYGLFERRYLSVGNAFSIIFIFVISHNFLIKKNLLKVTNE